MFDAIAAHCGVERSSRSPPVSVVVPCYNQAHFLGEAIESILAQTYQHFEVVVVDDGSTDNTAAVASTYKDVRYVWQPNAGLSAARNTGMYSSNGTFIVFLDADDILLPCALEAGLACFKSHPECGFVYGGHRVIEIDGSLLWQKVPCLHHDDDQYLELLRVNHIAMHGTVMYRCDILKAAGGFNLSLAACEDYDVYLRIARYHPVYCHREVIAEYRQHGANMSRGAALMLVTSLAVLRAQRAHLGGNADYIRAYKEGLKNWRGIYGVQLGADCDGHLASKPPA